MSGSGEMNPEQMQQMMMMMGGGQPQGGAPPPPDYWYLFLDLTTIWVSMAQFQILVDSSYNQILHL